MCNVSVSELNLDHNIFIVGNKSGTVLCYQLDDYDEKTVPQYQNMSNIDFKKKLEIKTNPNLKVNCVKYTAKNELLVGLSNGSVAVYSHDKSNPECIYMLILQMS